MFSSNVYFFCIDSGVALGDLQCSVFALLKGPDEAALNVSTSAQLAYVHPTYKPVVKTAEKIEYYPYFDGKYLAVAASLNGGNNLATFVKTLQQWTMDLGFSVPQCKQPVTMLSKKLVNYSDERFHCS